MHAYRWDYGSFTYALDALQYLQELQEDGAIRHLALTNFDTKHMNEIYDNGIKIVSNQVRVRAAESPSCEAYLVLGPRSRPAPCGVSLCGVALGLLASRLPPTPSPPQVQYSVLDQRPGQRMAAEADKRGIKLLAYGTLLGGYLSEKYVGAPEPRAYETVSQQKYFNMIRTWGGWGLFQELLAVLQDVASKHKVSVLGVIDQPP
jgi:aryl-alcohol dehydrogenase-like predicted oxidoreductase